MIGFSHSRCIESTAPLQAYTCQCCISRQYALKKGFSGGPCLNQAREVFAVISARYGRLFCGVECFNDTIAAPLTIETINALCLELGLDQVCDRTARAPTQ
jgi:hypothetical protein